MLLHCKSLCGIPKQEHGCTHLRFKDWSSRWGLAGNTGDKAQSREKSQVQCSGDSGPRLIFKWTWGEKRELTIVSVIRSISCLSLVLCCRKGLCLSGVKESINANSSLLMYILQLTSLFLLSHLISTWSAFSTHQGLQPCSPIGLVGSPTPFSPTTSSPFYPLTPSVVWRACSQGRTSQHCCRRPRPSAALLAPCTHVCLCRGEGNRVRENTAHVWLEAFNRIYPWKTDPAFVYTAREDTCSLLHQGLPIETISQSQWSHLVWNKHKCCTDGHFYMGTGIAQDWFHWMLNAAVANYSAQGAKYAEVWNTQLACYCTDLYCTDCVSGFHVLGSMHSICRSPLHSPLHKHIRWASPKARVHELSWYDLNPQQL